MLIVVGAAIISGSGREILLVRERRDNNVWIFPGGRLEKGETPEECLFRELGEELPGLRFQQHNFRLLGVYTGLTPNGAEEIRLTVYRVLRAGRKFRLGRELEEALFTTDPETLNLAVANRKAIAALKREGYL